MRLWRGVGNLSSAEPRQGAVYAGPPRPEEYICKNPAYRYRVLNGQDEPTVPPQYFFWDENGYGRATADPAQSYTSSSDEATCMSFIGGYRVVPELVDGSDS